MVFITVTCPICQETEVIRQGKSKQGKQRYLCQNARCGTQTFILDYTYHGCRPSGSYTE